METIEMQLPFNTTLDEGIKMLRQKAEQTGMRVIAKFNGFILDSQYSDEENKTRITNHFRKKITDNVKKMLTDRETCNIDWEQRRYEIAKSAMVGLMAGHNAIYEAKKLVSVAMEYTDALIKELKRDDVRNEMD